MYKLQNILPEDKFNAIILEFSINNAQVWLERVKEVVGCPCYDDIKEEFKANQEQERKKLSEMNCLVVNKANGSRKTIFQMDLGADKHAKVDDVDKLFTEFFFGV